ncbi:MAG: tRNA (adenosine(37)-N6)-dimethylallyltransferase MiaA [Chloroflexi bacterium]|nr:MAG: tRNA (adenosine(37)-N6)-dimethylallyltransferase MiaA [Chloroflexota bacterium]RLC80757.1 MAG: tRNA (adenosine(37)-N6)-dimethylallyltransferase MiaA [Chloroflexota bacterium]HEY72027.1 tRNA (adenosine(37)-N6)-dimethylallyltransferase MiaA [Thermoflexia bacterium]
MTASLDRNSLLALVGPTAVGKTALSLHLAERLDGEIVSADSRLLYRGMDVGTAKPTPKERARVPHHLIDIAAPDETVGLAEFQEQAYAAIDDIHARDKLPLLVGGTGQYVRAVVEGWRIPRVSPDYDLRAELEAQAEREGAGALHDWLARLDPVAARRIHPHNVRRIVRALEVCTVTGRPISEQQGKRPPPYRILQIGLTMEREALYARADRRTEAMMDAGLAGEVRQLVEAGYRWELPAMSGLGYVQFKPHFEEEMSLEEVAVEIKGATHSFIRRQYNWFSLDDPAIRWFDVTETTAAKIEAVVREWLGKQGANQ